MMDFENICIWCWVIPLLVGILCAILGYLIGKGSRKGVGDPGEIQKLKDENSRLAGELDACNKKLSQSTSTKSETGPGIAAAGSTGGVSSSLTSGGSTFNAASAKAAMGKRVSLNDLKVVEGIGPKIEGLFHNFDIKTWKALADCTVSKCQEVLDSGGDRYRVHDPASWPMQARMCHEGKWKELAKWQDEHKHGKL